MDRQEPVKVATITVGTNELQWLKTCFASLTASDTTGIELHIRYVDNASTDGSPHHVSKLFPRVKVTRNPANFGFARANNVGMRLALEEEADYVFLVNPDTRTPASLVGDLVGFMENHSQYGIVGPMQYVYCATSDDLSTHNEWSEVALKSGERHGFAADWPSRRLPAGPLEGRAPNTLEHAYVQGSAFFVRAEVLRTAGLFDEVFHTYYEETDLCRRARWAGWRVALLLDLGIQHKGGGGAGHGHYRRIQMRRNRYYYLFTDVDWAPPEALCLAGRWLWKDLHGNSVGGRTNPARGTLETCMAAAWLGRRLPQIIDRRRRYRRLAATRPAMAHIRTGNPDSASDTV
ncbi:MAG: glycosyltransferase family 2 protein [Pseudonocardiaceae bacterium]